MKKAGYITPAVTVFDDDGSLDAAGLKNVYEHLIRGNMDGIVIMGSTGEFFSMSAKQKRQLIDIASETIAGRVRLYVGAGSMRMEESLEIGNYALERGAAGVMAISPWYFPLGKSDIIRYYSYLAEHLEGNIFLYNFPAVTGHDISPEIVLELLKKYHNITGYKDTVKEMSHTRGLMDAVQIKYPGFQVYSGYDDNLLHVMAGGGSGCVGGLSNICPEIFRDWSDAIYEGDTKGMEVGQRKANKLCRLLDMGLPFVPVIKRAMQMKGVEINDFVSFPFQTVMEEEEEGIRKILKETEECF